MTDYDPKPTAVHQQERYDDNNGSSIWKWLIPLLVLGAIIAFLVIFFDVDQTKEGNLDVDVNAELPEFDVDAADVDIDMPEVTLPKISVEGGSIEGGDIDVTLPKEGCEGDDISAADCVVPDVDVDVDMDADVDVNDPQ